MTSLQFHDKMKLIKDSTGLSSAQKVSQLDNLKSQFEKCGLKKDSVYASILHYIGLSYYKSGNLNEAIRRTIQSVSFNVPGRKESNRKFSVNSYSNLGLYCKESLLYNKTLEYLDTCIEVANGFSDPKSLGFVINARLARAEIYFQKGDYQKNIEEVTLGLKSAFFINDSLMVVNLLHQRAQAYAYAQIISEALKDINQAFALIKRNDFKSYANNYKIKAKISEIDKSFGEAESYHQKAIDMSRKAEDTAGLAGDYLDAGITLRNHGINYSISWNRYYSIAQSYYKQALKYAQIAGKHVLVAKALNNLGGMSFRNRNYLQAVAEYHKSILAMVLSFTGQDVLKNPTYSLSTSISDKNFLSTVLGNKTEALLHVYKQMGEKQYLTAALRTAVLTDSLITDMRHEQAGELSKLYWRNETREFYSNAIEACYQADDHKLAFYFMEKSRAVLLNDKLNELGAFAMLPSIEAAREQSLRINILSQNLQLAKIESTDPAYREQQVKLLEAKEQLEKYIKTLQFKYPAYYQYKYADDVPDLSSLQKYLAANMQSFVHYFINDSAIYVLGVSALQTRLIKILKPRYNEELRQFIAICSDKQALNNNYSNFALKANSIYETLFRPLQLYKGRVIICQDNFLIPFEVLATDGQGTKFLVYDYAFSYVYSARALLKKSADVHPNGNFLGVAPSTYASYLHVPELKQSEQYLKRSAANYSGVRLMTNKDANKWNLLNQLPNYSIVNIYSHARADSTDQEPVLFMSDSLLMLSELQRINHPSTQLVVLTACQTSVGKNAAGEGVLSLARGFSSAGIPSVAATLWKADEQASYNITDIFHQNLAKGMRKDDALQNAKLAFIGNGSKGARLPFYWATMILVGNGEPLKLAKPSNIWWLAGGILLMGILTLLAFYKTSKGGQ